MPGGNGFLVAERIHDLEAMLGVPCMFMTASKQPGLRDQARRLGAAGLFEKPYDAGALLATIGETLDARVHDGDLGESTILTWVIEEADDAASAGMAAQLGWGHRIAW